jgi:intracellular septation protein A
MSRVDQANIAEDSGENEINANSETLPNESQAPVREKDFWERKFGEKRAKQLKLAGFLFQHIILEIALPLTLYFTLKGPIGELKAVIISSVPSLLSTVFTVLVKRRFEPLPIIIIVSFFIGLGLSLGFNNAKLNEIKGAIITGCIGLAYIISLLFEKPLIYYFSRPWQTQNDPEKIKKYDEDWKVPEFRRVMRVISIVWGTGFILQAIVNIVLIFTVSLDLIIVLGNVLTYGNIALLVTWTFLYTAWLQHRAKKRGELGGGSSGESSF